MQKKPRKTKIRRTTTPPTTPPMIGPMGLEGEVGSFGVSEVLLMVSVGVEVVLEGG